MQQEIGFDFPYTTHVHPSELQLTVWVSWTAAVLLPLMRPPLRLRIAELACRRSLVSIAFPAAVAGLLLFFSSSSCSVAQQIWVVCWAMLPRAVAIARGLRPLRSGRAEALVDLLTGLWIWLPAAAQSRVHEPDQWETVVEYAWLPVLAAFAVSVAEFILFRADVKDYQMSSRSQFVWSTALLLLSAGALVRALFLGFSDSKSQGSPDDLTLLVIAFVSYVTFGIACDLVWRRVFFDGAERLFGRNRRSMAVFALIVGVWLTLFLGGASEPVAALKFVPLFTLPAVGAGLVFRANQGWAWSLVGALVYGTGLLAAFILYLPFFWNN